MNTLQFEGRGSSDSWDEYNFNWLFDPDRFDHLPIEEQVKRYKCRDLQKAKLYKCAAKIWGEPRSRVRRIVAPPMCVQPDPPEQSSDAEPEIVAFRTSFTNSGTCDETVPTSSDLNSLPIQVMPEAVASYRKWLGERKALRSGLESLGLNAEWLARKPDKSLVELRVLEKILEEQRSQYALVKETLPEINEASQPRRPLTSKVVPVIKHPSPEAVLVIEKFLCEKRLRLIDLFQELDKDKNWRITAEEFRNAIKRNAVPLTNVQVEELLMVFSDDCTGSLNYRDLVRCLDAWRKEKKEARLAVEAEGRNLPDDSCYDVSHCMPEVTRQDARSVYSAKSTTSGIPHNRTEDANRANGVRSKPTSATTTLSSLSSSRPGSSGFLEPPEPDLRPEKMAPSTEAMVDIRRHNQHSLHLYAVQEKTKPPKGCIVREQKPMIKTGEPEVDAHCAPSTIGGDTSECIDRYRQLLLREYTQLCHLCQRHQLPLTVEILQKALLHPEDKQSFGVIARIRQPQDLLSRNFYQESTRNASGAALSRNPTSSTIKGTGTSSSFTTHSTLDTRVDSSPKRATNGTDVTRESGTRSERKSESCSNKSAAEQNRALAKSFRSQKSLTTGVPRTVKLSTGRARISSKVDCWMTFEEFVQLTEAHRLPRRTETNRPTKHNAYWPGQLLDKLCLVLDGDKGNSIFHKVTKNRPAIGGYNNLGTWPINDSGYVLYGTIDK